MSTAPLPKTVHIVGGGLAGSEAAWQALSLGLQVVLYEMRPTKTTPAHQTGGLAELVCSNTFKSMNPDSAPGQLKFEMRLLNSLILKCAEAAKIPAGQALGVDRNVFSQLVTKTLEEQEGFTRVDTEISEIPSEEHMAKNNECWVIASGPLTSPALADCLAKLCENEKSLYFYDAIAPIIATESIDMEKCFFANRYEDGSQDYLNIPLNKEEYNAFVDAIAKAECTPLHEFESTKYFEACLPIEVMVERGPETLRFGPMKPVGLFDPVSARRPWAALQLRRENAEGTMYSMVGFQTKMKWGEQARVFSMLPALKNAEFFRFGSVHRNTYVNGPKVLTDQLSFRSHSRVFLAGQITGVEGYGESAAIGLLAGRAASALLLGKEYKLPPASSVIGALANYVTKGGLGKFQPMNANMGLLPPVEYQKKESKDQRRGKQCELARVAISDYLVTNGTPSISELN